jgi:hypothetical protein
MKVDQSRVITLLKSSGRRVAVAVPVLLAALAARGQVVISTNFAPYAGSFGGFFDYAQGNGLSQATVNGNTVLQYTNTSGQYWGQIVGQSWANSGISIANMQANPILDFDINLSQANWGNFTFIVEVNNDNGNGGSDDTQYSFNLNNLIEQYGQANPVTEHVSLDLTNLGIQSHFAGGAWSNLIFFFQPQYAGYADPTNNYAWNDKYRTQTYFVSNMQLLPGVAKTNALWSVDADGNWSSASNWSNNQVPSKAGDTANFGPTAGQYYYTALGIGAHTITLDAPETVGVINFYNPNTTIVTGSNPLTLAGATGVTPAINVAVGHHQIQAPVEIAGDTAATVTTGASLAVSTISGPHALNVSGGGTLSVTGSLAVSTLSVSAGTLVDLTGGSAVLSGMTEAQADALVSQWLTTGSGLGSSLASSTTTLGVITNSDGQGGALYSVFDGNPTKAGDALVAYTYIGDTTLKGSVDATDLANTLAGLYGGLTGWENGDFTYSGTVTAADVTLVLNALSTQGSPLGGGSGGGSGAVPEPSALAVVLAAVPLLGRRRR